MTTRCYWCGRYGATPTTYQLHPSTPEYTRNLCPPDAESALEATRRSRIDKPQHKV